MIIVYIFIAILILIIIYCVSVKNTPGCDCERYDDSPKKIAFCFLIYDIINHEDIWNMFFKNIDKKLYTIYIHYKYNKPLKYFEKYKLDNCIDTKYENETIPLAYNVLFREAYKDENNYKFVIVSNSCIPLKSFNYVYNKLTMDNYGYFNVSPHSQCFPNCNYLLQVMEKKNISKSHNWFILNRKLVKNLCFDLDSFLKKHYKTIYAPAEYFYYTFIKILNLQNEIITTHNVAAGATTFTNWSDMEDYPYQDHSALKNYSFITQEELSYLLDSKSLFGRKFKTECKPSLMNDKYISFITNNKDVSKFK